MTNDELEPLDDRMLGKLPLVTVRVERELARWAAYYTESLRRCALHSRMYVQAHKRSRPKKNQHVE